MRLARGLAAAGFALAGCSFLVDLDVTGGVRPDGGADGAVSDAVSDDGTATEAGSNDGGLPNEPPDASLCGETFCDDFDHYGLGVLWTGKALMGGTLVLDNVFSSPPHALRADTNAAGAPRQALLFRRFEPRPRSIDCHYRVQAIAAGGAVDLSGFTILAPGFKYYTISLHAEPAASYVIAGANYDDGGTFYAASPLMSAIPTTGWVDVTMSANWDTRHLEVVVDETSVLSTAIPAFDSGKLDVCAGINWQDDAADNAYRFDDYRCSVTP